MYDFVKAEGPAGIYRGLMPTIAKSASNQALRFGIFGDPGKVTIGSPDSPPTVAELPQIDQHATLTWIKGVNAAHTLKQFGLPQSARAEICPEGYYFAVPLCKLCPCTPGNELIATCAGDQQRICDPAVGMGTVFVKGLIALALVSGFLYALWLMTDYDWPDDDVDPEDTSNHLTLG